MLFATFIVERPQMEWKFLPAAIIQWCQSAGILAAFGLFLIAVFTRGNLGVLYRNDGQRAPYWYRAILPSLSLFAYLAVVSIYFARMIGVRGLERWVLGPRGFFTLGDIVLGAGGLFAILFLAIPMFRSVLFDFRWGRVWAVARLGIKEQIRNRGIFIFGFVALIFLFADWFVPYKAEDQVRNYVRVLYFSLTPLYILAAAYLGAFSIPNDVRTLTIHTVVTKPITKFEIVVGRFLGYAALLTVGIFTVALVSLLYIARGVTEEAKAESFTARVPVYGQLEFHNTKDSKRGDSVGREWDYRSYIGGMQMSANGRKQYAGWLFPDLSEVRPLPGDDANPGKVRIQFTFDIFRLTKGVEGKGVSCSFLFAEGRLGLDEVEKLAENVRLDTDRIRAERQKKAGGGAIDFLAERGEIQAEMLAKHGYYEDPAVEIIDYQTQFIDVPYALFEKMRVLHQDAKPAVGQTAKPPAMQVLVTINRDRESQAQMLGVARHDLYILADEKPFFLNFLKGMIGLWLATLLVLAVAIACSTYLSGVISFICTLFLYIAGNYTPDIVALAEGRNYGGGPLESSMRILTRKPVMAPLDDTPTTAMAKIFDDSFRWALRLFINVLPDVDRYDLHAYVAHGFDISWTQVLFADNLLGLIGYLLPWAVLAFYLMQNREIANPM